jgi:hypothetical protein
LIAGLYILGRFERLLYVGEQLETVLFEGVPHRIRSIQAGRSWKKRKGKSSFRLIFEMVRPFLLIGFYVTLLNESDNISRCEIHVDLACGPRFSQAYAGGGSQ